VLRRGSREMRRYGWIALGIVAVLGLGWTGAALGDGANTKEIEGKVHTFVLPNGLRFIVLERHDAPVFSFRTYVNAGSVDETPGATGIAHMFEHMAFKGTTHIGTTDWPKEQEALKGVDRAYAAMMAEKGKGAAADTTKVAALKKAFDDAQAGADKYVVSNEYSKVCEQAGANDLNAGTRTDYTEYQADFPSNKLELWAMTEGDRLANPVLREFFKERDVVIEERRMRYESTGSGRLFLDFLDGSFSIFPYKAGPIGRRADLESFSREQAMAFRESHYVAENMVVAVVGDVSKDEIDRLAIKYFSGVSDRAPAPPVSVVEPPQTQERRIVRQEDEQPIVFFGYHIPAVTDPHYHAYEALTDILGEGRSGRLYTKLVKEQKIAVQLGMNTGFPGEKYPNLLFGVLIPASGMDPDTVLAAMDREIARLQTSAPVTEDELAGFKTRKLASFWHGIQQNGDMAEQLVYYEGMEGDWHKLFRQVDEVNAVTVNDVMDAAKALRAENRTVGILHNSGK